MGAYAIIIATAIIVNISGYIFVVAVARLLGPSDYSAFASLIAIATIVIMGICGPLQTIIARYVSSDNARGNDDNARYLVTRAFLIVAILGSIAALIVVSLAWSLKGWLRIGTLPPMILLTLYIGVSFVQPITAGTVQGLQRFKIYGISLVAGAISLVALGVTLTAIGLGVSGAMAAEVVSVVVTVSILASWVRRWMRRGQSEGSIDLSHLKRFAPAVVVASTCMAAFIYVDVFLVRGLIGGSQAGYYAGAQKLGTMVFLVPGVFGIVFFPRASANTARGIPSWGLLARVEAAVALFCGIASALLILFPDWLLKFVFGGKYTGGVELVPLFALAMFCFSLLSIGVLFSLATDDLRFVFILLPAVTIEIISILFFHNSILTIARIIALVSLGTLLSMSIYLVASWLSYRSKHPQATASEEDVVRQNHSELFEEASSGVSPFDL